MTDWRCGTSRVVSVSGNRVVVACPFCGLEHEHMKSSIGSKEVLAGCHVGPVRCRSYAIPEAANARKMGR